MIAGRSEVEPKLSKSSSTEWIQYLNGFERGFAPLWPVWVSDTLNQHSQESIHQDVLPKKWDVNTRKLIIIKAFVTLGKPKANNRENVLGSVLCAFSVLPRFHPFAQVFSETPPPPEPFCSPPRGLLTHLLPQRRVTQTPVLPRFRRCKTELFISRYTSTQALEHSRRVGNMLNWCEFSVVNNKPCHWLTYSREVGGLPYQWVVG